MQRMSLSGFCGSAPTSRPKGATRYRGLTVEAVEEQPRLPHALSLLFGRHLDAGRGEQEHGRADPLDAPGEPVGETGGEVEQATGDLAVGRGEVDDHRSGHLE